MAEQTRTNNFDFDQFNNIMKGAGSGLKLFIAEQLLTDVHATMARFRNPLSKDMNDIIDELVHVRAENKKLAAKRENTTSGEIDNATTADGLAGQASTSADGGRLSDVSGKNATTVTTEPPLANPAK